MVTSVSASRTALFLDGCTDPANDLRLQIVSASLTATGAAGTTGIAATPGVRQGVGTPMKCTWTSLLSFTLSAGVCYVQGSASTTAGLYAVTLDTTTTLACTTADATNPRIDSVAAVVTDNGDNTSTAVFKIITGTASPSPSAPPLPSNALLLCNITVPAGATALSAGAFADKRVFTVASGGILPYTNTAGASIPGPKGSYLYDQTTDRLKALDGSGNARQPKTAAFAAVNQNVSGPVSTTTSGYTTLASVTVTVDGVTEIDIYGSWTWLTQPAGVAVGDYCQLILTQDGFSLSGNSSVILRAETTNTNPWGGGNLRDWGTLAAGTHTIALQALSTGHAFPVVSPRIRVAPSMQQ